MNFMLIGKVVYGDCSGEGCKDISEEFEVNDAKEAVEKARKILKPYKEHCRTFNVKLCLAKTIWTADFVDNPRSYWETPTMYLNLLGSNDIQVGLTFQPKRDYHDPL